MHIYAEKRKEGNTSAVPISRRALQDADGTTV